MGRSSVIGGNILVMQQSLGAQFEGQLMRQSAYIRGVRCLPKTR